MCYFAHFMEIKISFFTYYGVKTNLHICFHFFIIHIEKITGAYNGEKFSKVHFIIRNNLFLNNVKVEKTLIINNFYHELPFSSSSSSSASSLESVVYSS